MRGRGLPDSSAEGVNLEELLPDDARIPVGRAPDRPVTASPLNPRTPPPLCGLKDAVRAFQLAEKDAGTCNHRVRETRDREIAILSAIPTVVMMEAELSA